MPPTSPLILIAAAASGVMGGDSDRVNPTDRYAVVSIEQSFVIAPVVAASAEAMSPAKLGVAVRLDPALLSPSTISARKGGSRDEE